MSPLSDIVKALTIFDTCFLQWKPALPLPSVSSSTYLGMTDLEKETDPCVV